MATPSASNSTATSPLIIDLGKQKRKRVKQLRKGRGRLFGEVAETVESLQDEGTVDKNAQVVYVVVRQKRRTNSWFR